MGQLENSASGTETLPQFLRNLRSSHVLSAAKCDEIEATLGGSAAPVDSRELARDLVRNSVLTDFQARRVLAGRTAGLVIGRYVVLDHIGSGGMGRVYKAKHMMMGRIVALKVVITANGKKNSRAPRLRREMQMVGMLDHPNIVRAFDADQIGDVPYIVMEYVPGETLDSMFRARGKIPAAEALWYGIQAAKGLDHAHKRGVIHRDIKPSNLLLSRDGQIKLLDLGLGVFLDRDPNDECKTEIGTTVGTADYLSPEQACLERVDGRSDIYSLGCTLFHLMSGRLPFDGESSMKRLAMRITSPMPPTCQSLPGLPEPVCRALDRMLARDPVDRFQTAGEVVAALTALIRPRSAAAPAMPDASTPRTRPDARPADALLPAPSSPTPSIPAPSVPPGADPSGLPASLSAWPSRLRALRAHPRRRVAAAILASLGLISAFVILRMYGAQDPTVGNASIPTTRSDTPASPPAPVPDRPSPADLLAESERWAEAATAFGSAAISQPDNLSLIHRRALALLKVGDVDACRRLCDEKLRDVRGSTNPGVVDVVRAGCLLPSGLAGHDWAVSLCRDASQRDPKAAWRLYILGLVHFRLGQFEEAARRLDESGRIDPYWAGTALNWPILAMTHGHLGHTAEALTWLEKARTYRNKPKRSASSGSADGAPWYDRVEFELLTDEAESQLAAKPPDHRPKDK